MSAARVREALRALRSAYRADALDGKGQINKANASVLSAAVRANPVGQTDLFEYRACLNGNLHLTFRREDLLAKFNQIAGGRRLRPSAA